MSLPWLKNKDRSAGMGMSPMMGPETEESQDDDNGDMDLMFITDDLLKAIESKSRSGAMKALKCFIEVLNSSGPIEPEDY